MTMFFPQTVAALRKPRGLAPACRTASLAAAFLLSSLLTSAQTPPSHSLTGTDQASLKRALDAYDAGDLKTAEPLLVALASRHPSSYEANEALGSLYAESGRTDLAIASLRRACRIAPQQGLAHANLGAAYLKGSQLDEAVSELKTSLKLDPHNGSTLSNLGQAWMLKGKPRDAAPAFAEAAALRPDDPQLAYDLALALYESGSLKEAGAALGRISPEGSSDQVESLAGDVAEKLGDFKAAFQHYQAAAQKNPSDQNIYALAIELLRHWTWDQAFTVASFGESRYPESTHFRVLEGIARYGGSKFPESAAIFSGLLATDPGNSLYADLLGRSCGALAEDATAECSGLTEFAQRHPENAQAATYAAVSLLHQPAATQDKAEVKRLLDQAIAADPKAADAYFQRGVLEQSQLQWKESVTSLERAIELRPTYPEAHYRLSRAYAHLGMREQAQQEIALQQKFSQDAKDSLNAHLQEVVTFLVNSH